jgi:hypothetical protein
LKKNLTEYRDRIFEERRRTPDRQGFTVGSTIVPGYISPEFRARLRNVYELVLPEPKDPRYQHQSWLVRRWRDRYNFLIPVWAVRWWYYEQTREDDEEFDRMYLAVCWNLACGHADFKKRHYYRIDELNPKYENV